MAGQLLSANHAAALGAALAGRANRSGRGFCSGVYPITPSTECMELLCNQEIEKGHVVRVESEHSAMAVCIGAAASGARTFTTSSSNGIAYMAENVVAAALLRLPVVMVAANRTLGSALERLGRPRRHAHAARLRVGPVLLRRQPGGARHRALRLPAGRGSPHPAPGAWCARRPSSSPTPWRGPTCRGQEQVDRFLPPLDLPNRIDGAPRVVGGVTVPHATEVHRAQHQQAMGRVWDVYQEVQDGVRGGLRPPAGQPRGPVPGRRRRDAGGLDGHHRLHRGAGRRRGARDGESGSAGCGSAPSAPSRRSNSPPPSGAGAASPSSTGTSAWASEACSGERPAASPTPAPSCRAT